MSSASDSKVLGRWDSIAISIGIVIGVGIFGVPQEIAQLLPSSQLILIAWLVGGLFSLAGGFCYAELAAAHPESGGDYIYLREAYGPVIAFLFAWTELMIIRTGSNATVALLFAEYACSLVSLDKSFVTLLAVSVIVILSIINSFGIKYGARVQNVVTILKVVALLILIVFGLTSGKGDVNNFASSSLPPVNLETMRNFLLALIPILWTYGGWRDNVFLAGETKDAHKSVPFALLSACTFVTVIYLLMNSFYLYLMTPEKIAHTRLIANEVLMILWGPLGAKLLEGIIVVSALGVINAMLMTGSQIAHAMSKDNPMFESLERINDKTGTPLRALIFNGTWSCLLVLIGGSFEKLLYFTGFAVWFFFSLIAASVILLRLKRPGLDRTFKVPAYPVLPALLSLISMALCINTLVSDPDAPKGVALVLAGLPVLFIQRKLAR